MMSTQNKQKCNYLRHPCSRFRYHEYKYCFQHILESKAVSFMACQYVSKVTKRRCHNPALKSDLINDSSLVLCDVHNFSMFLPSKKSHRKAVLKKETRRYTGHSRRSSLSRFKKDQDNIVENTKVGSKDDAYFGSYNIDSSLNNNWLVSMSPSRKGGETEIDNDVSDDDENYLKNAGTYTYEEVITASKNCMTKLRSLYVAQFKQLQRKLLEKRRQYLFAQESSEEGKSDVIMLDQDRDKASELRSILQYHQHSKENALLHRQAKQRKHFGISKDAVTPTSVQSDVHSSKSRCAHISNHTRCKGNCLPYTKYCKLHILEDPLQVLYKKCSFQSCPIPVCLLPFAVKGKVDSDDEGCFCSFHDPLLLLNPDLDILMKRIKEDEDCFAMEVDVSSIDAAANSKPSVGYQQSKKFDVKVERMLLDDDDDDVTNKIPDGVITSEIVDKNIQSPLTTPVLKSDVTNLQEIKKGSFCDDASTNMLSDDVMTHSDVINSDIKCDVAMNDDTLNTDDVLQDGEINDVIINDDNAKSDAKNNDGTNDHARSSTELDRFETGRCYIMSRVSMCDESDPSGVPALHLKSFTSTSSGVSSILIPETTGNGRSTQQTAPRSDSSVLQLPNAIGDCSKSSIGIHHHGSVMSITNSEASQSDRGTVVAVSTLIPPVGGEEINEASSHRDDQDLTSESISASIKEMPPLAPLRIQSHTEAPQGTNEIAQKEDVKLGVAQEIKPDTEVAPGMVVDASSTEVSLILPEEHRSPLEISDNESKSRDSDQAISKSSPALSDQSEDNECEKINNRKPSSTDEETAVASLLSLSSGTIPSD